MNALRGSLGPNLATLVIAAAAVVSGVTAAGSQGSEGGELPLSDCADAVGTYLTINQAEGESGDAFISRSLISFTDSGQLAFVDSGQGGEPGYAPFSEGLGAWRCVSNEGELTRLVGSVLDFTFPSAGEQQRIGRLDIEATFNKAEESLAGRMVLYFVPLDANPLDPTALAEDGVGTFAGQRVAAP